SFRKPHVFLFELCMKVFISHRSSVYRNRSRRRHSNLEDRFPICALEGTCQDVKITSIPMVDSASRYGDQSPSFIASHRTFEQCERRGLEALLVKPIVTIIGGNCKRSNVV
ncbi:hypothetical protein Moror_6225, partial [Moniliophthora roreri MCA 2997]